MSLYCCEYVKQEPAPGSAKITVGIYDTGFLDWVLFASLPLFGLEGTEHMD